MQHCSNRQEINKNEKGGDAMNDFLTQPKSKFLKVRCSKCKKESIVFGSSATKVECKCGEVLVEPTGGKSKVKARILEVLG